MNAANYSINEYNNFSSSQILILKAIIYYSNKHGFPPTVRELCDIVGLKSTSTIHSHLKKLEKKGYIVKKPSSPRSITLTDKATGEGLYSGCDSSFNINDELESVMKNLRNVINCDDLYIDNIRTKKKTLYGISQLVTDALIKMDSINS